MVAPATRSVQRCATLRRDVEGQTGRQPGSWPNMVEIFFSIIAHQTIHRGSFSSVKELVAAIGRFIDGWNGRCHLRPCVWTKTGRRATRPL
jgi:hypothetical protein